VSLLPGSSRACGFHQVRHQQCCSAVHAPVDPRAPASCNSRAVCGQDVSSNCYNICCNERSAHRCNAAAQTSATERAAQLAEVAVAVYDKGGTAIRLPLDGDHPLVAVMAAAVRKEQVLAVHIVASACATRRTVTCRNEVEALQLLAA
jgi:hypothetical protein